MTEKLDPGPLSQKCFLGKAVILKIAYDTTFLYPKMKNECGKQREAQPSSYYALSCQQIK